MDLSLRKCHLESLLNILQDLLVGFAANERDRETFGTKTAGTSNTMEIRSRISWEVVVDSQVDPLDINTTAKDVSRHADSLVELFELFVPLDAVEKFSRIPLGVISPSHTVLPG
jgi:hypothetical protein